ncbi:MAG: FtsX-like permease family protein [Actinomycetota bacterium]
MPVLVLFAIAYGLITLFAWRRPLLRKLAVREAVRRRGQTALVVAGLMVGTATITAALVASDSVGDSAVDSFAYRNWGHVDITVSASNRFFQKEIADRLASDPEVTRTSDGVAGGLELIGSAADLDRRQGTSRVVLVGFDPARQAPFGAYDLVEGGSTTGEDLALGEVLVSRVLAEKIDARAGDRMRFTLEVAEGTQPIELRIAGIARQEGPGAYTLGAAVFAPLPTAQRIAGVEGINIIRVSALGGIRDSLDAAPNTLSAVQSAVARIDAPVPLEVSDAKRAEAKNAEGFTTFIRAMLVGMSSLVVAVGAALVVNIIGMLAEERRSRMGVLRALGLKRRRLVGLSVIEGAIYSLAAGVVGIAVGVAAGRLVASRFGRAFAEFAGEDFDFQFFFVLKPATVLTGFAIGSVLTLVVITFASWRTSRMTITAAIRNLPEPPRGERPRWLRITRAVFLSLLTLLGVAGIVGGEAFPRMIGGLAVILVASSLMRGRLSPRAHATLFGLALAGWSFSQVAGQDPNADVEEFFGVFVFAMLSAVFGLTILTSGNLHIAETIVGVLGRAFAGLRAILRPPLAYLSRRPMRTGLTTGVFAVIIGMLAMFAVFFIIFRPAYDRFGNGYDVRVLNVGSPRIDIPDSVLAQTTRSITLPTRGYIGSVASTGDDFSNSERMFLPLFEVPPTVAADPPLKLEQLDDAYDTDRQAWQAVATDPTKIITNFGVPGEKLTLDGKDGPVTYTVVGFQSFGLIDGVIGTAQAFIPFADTQLGATMLLDLKRQDAALPVARQIESELFETGVDADSVQALLDQADRANRAFFSTIDVLMRMGLIIGILSLGIVALRVVTERRHVIGVLRAIGYKRRAVMAGLMTESAVTATIGVFVGMVVGLTMGYLFYRQQDSKPGFGVDWASIGGILGIVYVAVLLVTLGPAWRASRLPPAEAVRYSE